MRRHFQMFADYNRWANEQVYEACEALSDEEYRAHKGAYFGSACRTLNHLLVADRIWMRRLTGSGDAPKSLDAILFPDFEELRAARRAEDRRIIEFVDGLDDDRIAGSVSYTMITTPTTITQPLGLMLAHVFNHQTHHRGQVHMILTATGKPSLVLDLVHFPRTEGSRWM